MSIWTHVTGAIRIDGLPLVSMHFTVANVRKILGKTCSFGDNLEKWDECTVPRGSEGSLQFTTIEQYGNGLPWVVVGVHGDLRDYDNVEEIKHWWHGLMISLMRNKFIVRQGTILVEVEGKDDRWVFTHHYGVDLVTDEVMKKIEGK